MPFVVLNYVICVCFSGENRNFASMSERIENILMWIITPFFIIWEVIVRLTTWNLPKETGMRLPYISLLVSLLSLFTSILIFVIRND